MGLKLKLSKSISIKKTIPDTLKTKKGNVLKEGN